jgi:hypothetical protein
MTVWIIIDDTTGIPVQQAFRTEQAAWVEQVRLARDQDRSPYEWAAHAVQVDME